MISSPCTTCIKKDQPKDKCIQDCTLLQAMQEVYVPIEEGGISPAIDYAEEGRFTINSSGLF